MTLDVARIQNNKQSNSPTHHPRSTTQTPLPRPPPTTHNTSPTNHHLYFHPHPQTTHDPTPRFPASPITYPSPTTLLSPTHYPLLHCQPPTNHPHFHHQTPFSPTTHITHNVLHTITPLGLFLFYTYQLYFNYIMAVI